MIPADLGTELARAIAAAVAAGDLPGSATGLTASGTWRPARASAGTEGGPGTYATSLAFALARLAGTTPGPLAALLAEQLGEVAWVAAARVTGGGYLTVTVSAQHLAGLPARILAAGPAAARSDALAGRRLIAPPLPDLARAPNWERAWRSQHAALVGRLTAAAGGEVMSRDLEQSAAAGSTTQGQPGPVSAAAAHYGVDAVRYVLARTANPAARQIERRLAARLDLANPFVFVRYAHADAASALRWAFELGLTGPGQAELAPEVSASTGRVESAGELASLALTYLPPELSLLDSMSWLPERVAAAARRRRPAELTTHLEAVAAAWLDCRESCPALPFCGSGAPSPAAGPLAMARLMVADAARATLAAGLTLLGVSAPARA